tara:strand:+ start:70295 stop:70951 length:657 start_codon:yes stop_codon:yes gene_type:complete
MRWLIIYILFIPNLLAQKEKMPTLYECERELSLIETGDFNRNCMKVFEKDSSFKTYKNKLMTIKYKNEVIQILDNTGAGAYRRIIAGEKTSLKNIVSLSTDEKNEYVSVLDCSDVCSVKIFPLKYSGSIAPRKIVEDPSITETSIIAVSKDLKELFVSQKDKVSVIKLISSERKISSVEDIQSFKSRPCLRLDEKDSKIICTTIDESSKASPIDLESE